MAALTDGPKKAVGKLPIQSVLKFYFAHGVPVRGVPGKERGRYSKKPIYLFIFLLKGCRQIQLAWISYAHYRRL